MLQLGGWEDYMVTRWVGRLHVRWVGRLHGTSQLGGKISWQLCRWEDCMLQLCGLEDYVVARQVGRCHGTSQVDGKITWQQGGWELGCPIFSKSCQIILPKKYIDRKCNYKAMYRFSAFFSAILISRNEPQGSPRPLYKSKKKFLQSTLCGYSKLVS